MSTFVVDTHALVWYAIIAATAVVFRDSVDPSTALVTRDERMRAARIVKTIW